jgi:two-component system, sensor histidine kinase PdtaS
MGRFQAAIFLIILIITLVPVQGSCSEEGDLNQILYINSYNYGYSWSKLMTSGVYNEIYEYSQENERPSAYVNIEFMDSKTISDEAYFKNIYNLLSYKLKDNSPGVIIVSDDNALRFIREYGEDLFPGVPVVFTGINDYESILENRPENYTGTIENIPIEENLEFITGLRPDLGTLYIVTDDTYSGKIIREQTENISEKIGGGTEIRYSSPDLSPEEMLEEIMELPDNSAIFFITYNTRNSYGDTLYSDIYIQKILNQERIPVYTTTDQYNELGVAGGYQVSPYELGNRASVIALEIIGGTDPNDIPVDTNPLCIAALNYGDIKKYNLNDSFIPAGIQFFNKPSPMISIPRNFVDAIIILVLSLAAILVISLTYNNRLKNTETELKKSLDEKNVLLKEIHHRVKNNLAVIGSLVGMQVINSTDTETKQKLRDVGNRIISMSIVYDNLYQSENLSGTNAGTIFTTLGETLIRDYSMGTEIDFEVTGEECLINPEKAVPMSLAVNEIIGNSLKFAFEGRSSGKIRINYTCTEGRFDMTISDNGKGIDRSYIEGETESIGLNLIRNLVYLQLNGTAEVSSDGGTTWTISFPLGKK